MKVCYYRDVFDVPKYGMHFHLHSNNYRIHSHDYYEFFWILSGSCTHVTPSGEEPLTAGQAFLLKPEHIHAFTNVSGNYTQLTMGITVEKFNMLVSALSPSLLTHVQNCNAPMRVTLSSVLSDEILTTVHRLQLTPHDNTDAFLCRLGIMWLDLIKNLILSDLSHDPDYPEWLADFIKKINTAQYFTQPVQQIMELTNYSYSHFTRLFRQHTGRSLIDYIVELRLNYAAMLLKTTDLSILEISTRVGYDSYSHFTRLFRKKFGSTPKEFRILCRKNSG